MRYKIPDEVREEVLSRDKRTCQYCGKTKLYNRAYALDHVLPVAEGGANTPNNLVVSCKACNAKKGKKSVADFVKTRLAQLEIEKAQLEKILNDLA